MPEDYPKSAPGDKLEEISKGEQSPAPDAVQKSEIAQESEGQAIETTDPAGRKTLDISDEEDAPTIEIGELTDVEELPHDIQVELAVEVLDNLQSDDFAPEQSTEEIIPKLEDKPDSAFLVISEKSSTSLGAPALPADLMIMAQLDAAIDATMETLKANRESQEKPVDMRETIIPAIPITMDMSGFEEGDGESEITTKEYPLQLSENLRLLPEFNQSSFRKDYEAAVKQHMQEVKMHLSGVITDSSYPKPPSFQEYFDRFLEEYKKQESTPEQ